MERGLLMKRICHLLFAASSLLLIVPFSEANSQPRIDSQFRIARLKYSGGGDWYNGQTEEVNLLEFIQRNTNIDCDPCYEYVDCSSDKMFNYPFLFMTGHGNIAFSDFEVERLRTYLTNGGFLYADDDYGMDKAFRREIKKIFPDKDLVELPFSYGLYHCFFDFPGAYQKHMNTTENRRRDSEFFIRGDLSFIILMNRIQATAGMTRMCTEIPSRFGRKLCGSEQISLFGR